jgi:hypothetical protein
MSGVSLEGGVAGARPARLVSLKEKLGQAKTRFHEFPKGVFSTPFPTLSNPRTIT